jgi:putative ABC transport system ATP-binding protein
MLEVGDDPGVEFYDPDKITLAAPLRDNLLFGKVNESIANAREQVREVGAQVIAEMELSSEIERVGLDHPVGPAGRRLAPYQRAAINLVRCVVKRPDLLVVDGALAPFAERRIPELISFLKEAMEGRSLVMVLPNDRHLDRFDEVVGFEDGRIVKLEPKSASRRDEHVSDDKEATPVDSPDSTDLDASPSKEIGGRDPPKPSSREAAE